MTNTKGLSKSKIWLYGALSLPMAIVAFPIGVWIPRLYSTDVGLPLAAIGMVIFFCGTL